MHRAIPPGRSLSGVHPFRNQCFYNNRKRSTKHIGINRSRVEQHTASLRLRIRLLRSHTGDFIKQTIHPPKPCHPLLIQPRQTRQLSASHRNTQRICAVFDAQPHIAKRLKTIRLPQRVAPPALPQNQHAIVEIIVIRRRNTCFYTRYRLFFLKTKTSDMPNRADHLITPHRPGRVGGIFNQHDISPLHNI